MGTYTESCAITRCSIRKGESVFFCALHNAHKDDASTYGLMLLFSEESQRVSDVANSSLSASYRMFRAEYSRMQNVIEMCEIGEYDGYGWIREKQRNDILVRGVDRHVFFIRLNVVNAICGHDVSAPASSNIETLKQVVEFAFLTRTELFFRQCVGFQYPNSIEKSSHALLVKMMQTEHEIAYSEIE